MLTEFLFWLTEFSLWLSLSVVALGSAVSVLVIVEAVRRDWTEGGGGVTRVAVQPARMAVSRAPIPLALSLHKPDMATMDSFEVSLSTRPPWRLSRARLRLFAGVDVGAFHHVLRAPWHWFDQALEHNLFGAQGSKQAADIVEVAFPEEGAKTLTLNRPDESAAVDLGGTPRTRYPFVVILAPLRGDVHVPKNVGFLGALVYVIHIKDAECGFPTQIISTNVKHADEGGRCTVLSQIFLSGEDYHGQEGENDLADNGRKRCVVCQDAVVTRVIFPCRHACTCKRCFNRLRGVCPMCRAPIQSYFLLEEEPVLDDEVPRTEPDIKGWRRWRSWLEDVNHRFAIATGLQENY